MEYMEKEQDVPIRTLKEYHRDYHGRTKNAKSFINVALKRKYKEGTVLICLHIEKIVNAVSAETSIWCLY
jgi:hypothetical protein